MLRLVPINVLHSVWTKIYYQIIESYVSYPKLSDLLQYQDTEVDQVDLNHDIVIYASITVHLFKNSIKQSRIQSTNAQQLWQPEGASSLNGDLVIWNFALFSWIQFSTTQVHILYSGHIRKIGCLASARPPTLPSTMASTELTSVDDTQPIQSTRLDGGHGSFPPA